jgi:tetratricopeptide (TPR) repeat protein
LRLDPKYTDAYCTRGDVWRVTGEFDKAIKDYNQAIQLEPKNVPAHCKLAWLLASCPDAAYREPKRAVDCAQTAGKLAGQAPLPPDMPAYSIHEALAAAYAEAGDFDAAVKSQTRAVEFASKTTTADELAKLHSRLELYEAGKPYREEPTQ